MVNVYVVVKRTNMGMLSNQPGEAWVTSVVAVYSSYRLASDACVALATKDESDWNWHMADIDGDELFIPSVFEYLETPYVA